MRDESSKPGRCARSCDRRSTRTRAGCSPRCRARMAANTAGGCLRFQARSRCSATCHRAAPSTRGVPIDSSPAPAILRPTTPLAPSSWRNVICMPLVEVSHLVKHFVRGGGLLRAGTRVAAVDDVSFTIEEGETFGLVGESGSGKTTTGRCMLRLIEPTAGEVRFRGENVLAFTRSRMRQARRDMQIVFQDPNSSLNPRMRARQIVEEPLIIHRIGRGAERGGRFAQLFPLVVLNP